MVQIVQVKWEFKNRYITTLELEVLYLEVRQLINISCGQWHGLLVSACNASPDQPLQCSSFRCIRLLLANLRVARMFLFMRCKAVVPKMS